MHYITPREIHYKEHIQGLIFCIKFHQFNLHKLELLCIFKNEKH